MSFLDELQKDNNKTLTENSAVTNKSTFNPLLDFFSMAGAMRNDIPTATKLFEKALYTDKQAAMRILFYLRDIRGGQGERDLFRSIMKEVKSKSDKEVYATDIYGKVAKLIPEYGRWDDLFSLGIDETIAEIVAEQLIADQAAMRKEKTVSLMAKWLPSVNTSSLRTKHAARQLITRLGISEAEYRRQVVQLRKYIKLLEEKMSANEWPDIEYEKLPSQAQRKHIKAFKRHDEERYTKYLKAAQKGEKKMNTATLFTYEVFDAVQEGHAQAANAMWANLPDYTNGSNALVVADVSGSMSGRPMSVSVSLALYFAEHNTGPFNGYFMTFSDNPQLVKVTGNTLTNRLRMIENAHWDGITNIEAVFETILNAAKKSGAKGDDMPKVVYIISDMQFNMCVHNPSKTLFENAEQRFRDEGLPLPHIVFWNVNAYTGAQTPATMFDNRVTLISGLSQSTFRYAVEGKTPVELMESVINSDRYTPIVV
jgi:hypothetical protein